MGKRLELLKELVPGALPVAVLWDVDNLLFWKSAEAAARSRAWKVLSFEVRDAGQIEGAFKAATDAHAGAILVDAGPVLFAQRRRVSELALKNRLPAMYELRAFVEAGGLISYGTEVNDTWRRAAVYVDKILKGTKPRELPIEQPTKFELVINLTTAKVLRITIPPPLQMRADESIQ
jgi:putative ABC transport system substrate-binding protein